MVAIAICMMRRKSCPTYPDGQKIHNLYSASVLSSVQSATGAFSYAALTYNATAPFQVGRVLYGNGMSAAYDYDPEMQRLSELQTVTTTTIQNLGYQFDLVGNLTQIDDGVGTMSQEFDYDDLNRLVQSSGPYGARDYEYDSTGNLLAFGDKNSGFWNFSQTGDI